MFNRIEQTYNLRPGIVQDILRADASPLNRIAGIVPNGAKVLDIGAGNGLLAQVLKERHPDLIVDGIEPDPYAAEIARQHYRILYCGYAQDCKDKILGECYDFIVLADVLEHMSDPATFLKELAAELPEKTKIILSIPNVAFGAVRLMLLNGKFDYCDSGILEKTHLRFFTLATVEQLINHIGMYAEKLYFLMQKQYDTEIRLHMYGLNLGAMQKILRDPLSSTYQFLVVLSHTQTTCERKFFGEKTRFPLLAFFKARIKDYLK